MAMSMRSPTITPPVSSTWFQVNPNSRRSIAVVALNAARSLPQGSFARPSCSTSSATSRVTPLMVRSPMTRSRSPAVRVTALDLNVISYEAEQHLLHLGRAEEPVCWTLTGFASGYLSRAHGRQIYCLEERCRGMGDAVCRLVGRPIEEWGDTITPHLQFYQKTCLDAALSHVTEQLKHVEWRLRARRRELGDQAHSGRAHGALTVESAAMMRVLDCSTRCAGRFGRTADWRERRG